MREKLKICGAGFSSLPARYGRRARAYFKKTLACTKPSALAG